MYDDGSSVQGTHVMDTVTVAGLTVGIIPPAHS